jgi:response regulator NasT
MLRALRDLRTVRVVIYHPKDREGDELVAQIKRIGCDVLAIWPPTDRIPLEADVIFMLFRQDGLTHALLKALTERQEGVTLIAIVEFESPAVIEAISHAGATAIVTKPIRAFGLLTQLVLSITIFYREKSLLDRVRKLEIKLAGLKRLEKAKAILMSRKGVSEQNAYDAIRTRAMSERVSVDVICSTIIDADKFFGL